MAGGSYTQRALRINPARLRTWLNRLPFFTRIVFLVTVLFWILSLVLTWIPTWGALTPDQMSFAAAYQLNTYPVVHAGLIHTILGTAALLPLLERFEAENGTLVTAAMFVGPLSTIPGLLYVLVDHIIFRKSHAVLGANSWIFTLLSIEAIKTSRGFPVFNISTVPIPMWAMPLLLALFLSVTLPSFLTPKYIPISLLCNLCACLVGFAFELGYMKILLPPERVLRFLEGKLNLLGRLPHYVSVDQKTFGRYGVLPSLTPSSASGVSGGLMGFGIGHDPLSAGVPAVNGTPASTGATSTSASASGSGTTTTISGGGDPTSAAVMSNMEDGAVGTSTNNRRSD